MCAPDCLYPVEAVASPGTGAARGCEPTDLASRYYTQVSTGIGRALNH